MSRTNINLNAALIREARKLTGPESKREIVERALELFVASERRKGILRDYGSGIWKANMKSARRKRI